MSVLKRRSNNIKDGQYVIAFSDSRALIDISKDCGMTWTRRQPSDLPNVNEYFFSNDRTRIAMSGDGRHIYCSCYMANVGLLRSTDFLETAEPFKPDNCYSVYSIACNGRGNLVAVVCQNSNNKYDLMLSGDYGKTWRVSNGLKDNTVPLMGVEMSHSGRYVVAYASNSPYYTTHELFISSDYGETFSSEIFRGPITKIAISGDGKYMLCCCNRESSSKLYYAYYSGDYGKTWTKITDSSFSARTLAISYDGKYMVIEGGYSYSGARISADYGKTWALKHSVIGNSFALGLSSDGKYAIRVGLANSITIEQAAGKETTVLWYDTVKYVIPIPLALQMLAALELYALECYNATQEHLAAVMGLATKEEVGAYDYTSGYPEKLVFNL